MSDPRTEHDPSHPNTVSVASGQSRAFKGGGHDGKSKTTPNQRDPETGYPVGHASFAGAASPEHALPAAEDEA